MKCPLCDGPIINGRCRDCGMPYKSDEVLYHLNESSREHYRHATPEAREKMRRNRIPLGDEPKTHNAKAGTGRSGSAKGSAAGKGSGHAGGEALREHQEKIRREAMQRMNSGKKDGKKSHGQTAAGTTYRQNSDHTDRTYRSNGEPGNKKKKRSGILVKLVWILVILWILAPIVADVFEEKLSEDTALTTQGTSGEDDSFGDDTEGLEQWETEEGSGHMTYLMYADRKSKAEVGKDIEPDTYMFFTSDEKVTLTVEQKSTGETLEYTLKSDDLESPTLELKKGDLLYISEYNAPEDSVYITGWEY